MITDKTALISGGGPCGLAAALILKLNGWKRVTVIERRSVDSFETEFAYTYLVDGRGQLLTNLLNITEEIDERGINLLKHPLAKGFKTIEKDGKITQQIFPRFPSKVDKYMILRSHIIDILLEKIRDFNENQAVDEEDRIHLLFNTVSKSMTLNEDGSLDVMTETTSPPDSGSITITSNFHPSFLLACDGINSVVRQWMTKTMPNEYKLNFLNSPSVGLRYKMLKVKPNFPLPKTGELSNVEQGYRIETANNTPDTKFRAVFFPQRQIGNKLLPRVCANVSPANHKLWAIKTASEMKLFLEQSFPQFNISDLVDDEEISRFTAEKPGTFPSIQYLNKLYGNWPRSSIVVLGDAAHAFPPDLGAGLNSALEDVFRLHEALQDTQNDLTQALPLYQSRRYPEIKAMCKLAQFAFPYQYRQNMIWYYLYLSNFMMRGMLNRIAPSLYSPASFLLMQDHEVPYAKVVQDGHMTTRNILLTVFLFIIFVVLSVYYFRTSRLLIEKVKSA